jgi:hypothetical protein
MPLRKLLMRHVALLVALLCSSVVAAAREPWEWTVDERLQLRFDAAAVRERLSSHRVDSATRRTPSSNGVSVGEALPMDYISGKTHPELYLPFEIVTMFVRAAYGSDDDVAEGFRVSAAQRAASLGLPEDFMSVFAREADGFIAMMKEDVALRDRIASAGDAPRAATELELLELRLCPVRFSLMQRMRALYGSGFDRWLYGGLAPDWSTAIFTTRRDADTLRKTERGCQ